MDVENIGESLKGMLNFQDLIAVKIWFDQKKVNPAMEFNSFSVLKN